jgi:antitoxin component YwqK of YwqJK toxin-antitoxin module
MRFIFTTFFLILSIKLFACTCGSMPDFKTVADLKDYNFIALVKVTALAPIDTTSKFMKIRKNGDIKISVMERFKGNVLDTVYDPSFQSDCALNIEEGEQWIFFGYSQNGQTYISRCSYTVKYREVSGKRDWSYFSGIKQLSVLRNLYGHPITSNAVNKQSYPGGRIEVEQNFKNGRLNGQRTIYYPNGLVYITESFNKGERAGRRKEYKLNGQLIKLITYNNNLIKQSITYQDTAENAWYINYQIHHNKDPLFGEKEHDSTYFANLLRSLKKSKDWHKKVSHIASFSNDGLSYKRITYDYKGGLASESFQDWGTKVNDSKVYRKDGTLQYTVKRDQINNTEVEYDYDKNGKPKKFLRRCESCRFYFDINQPAAAPEPVFIQ